MYTLKEEENLMSNINLRAYFGIKRVREDGLFDLNEDEDVIIIIGEESGDGGGGVVVEEEVKEVAEEVVVDVKRKVEEETKPRATKKKRGKGFTWTEEGDDALLKGVGKYGLDFKQIREENDKVLADRTPQALRNRLKRQYPEKYKELRAATPRKRYTNGTKWTSEDDVALKMGVEVHGTDWEKIKSKNDVLKRRTANAIKERYNKHLK
ncbi:hypothetical protein TrVE_jg5107 [Triparma verrucosa]|uniref:Myb-like domain-containing protein n=1 Tax=Triparma verrucosa TaxID=1606542 RepID=A0A9W7B6X4_9STRA|nr:hypothetical protein TrVE_jg5107 [Triparma verrucosa]